MTPGLSVVVTVQRGQDAGRCLASLHAQDGAQLQTIVVLAPGLSPLPYDAVEVRQTRSRSLPVMVATGLGAATMPLVAITEAHCTFPPGWAAAVLRAQDRNDAAVIGGAVQMANDLSPIERALFYADYGAFLQPFEPRFTTDLPGNNIVFRRARMTGHFAHTGFWKTFYCRDLARRGELLFIDPSFAVTYGRRITLGAMLMRRFDHGRCFGAMRAAGSTVFRRIAYTIVAPLLPIALTARVGRNILRKPGHRLACFRVAYWVLIAMFAWVVGEVVGNVCGAGASCSRL